MPIVSSWKTAFVLCVFWVITAISSPAQIFDNAGHAKASPGLVSGTSGKLLSDNFILWTASSPLLNNLAAAWNGGASGFVAPRTIFTGLTGLQMSGLTQNNTLTGLQSLATFSTPWTVTVQVRPIEGTANPFAIFLVNADLSQYLVLYANVNTAFAFEGFWGNAPNIGSLDFLGEQFSPNIVPQFENGVPGRSAGRFHRSRHSRSLRGGEGSWALSPTCRRAQVPSTSYWVRREGRKTTGDRR